MMSPDRLVAVHRCVIIGEVHGNTAGPECVWACANAHLSAGRAVTVCVELPHRENARIQSWLDSDGGPQAHTALLEHWWSASVYDGRPSAAMFELLERARRARALGQPINLFAFVGADSGTEDRQLGHERRMAAGIAGHIAAHPQRHYVALCGNLHASRLPIPMGKRQLEPMAMHLSAAIDDLATVDLIYDGGASWVLMNQTELFSHRAASEPFDGIRRSARPAFDFEWFVGEAEPSPQAAQQA